MTLLGETRGVISFPGSPNPSGETQAYSGKFERGDTALLWRVRSWVWRGECGPVLGAVVWGGSQAIGKCLNRANPLESTVRHEGFLEEAVDEFGDGVGTGLATLGGSFFGQAFPRVATISCCLPLRPPVTSTSLAKPQEPISASSAPGTSIPSQPPPTPTAGAWKGSVYGGESLP